MLFGLCSSSSSAATLTSILPPEQTSRRSPATRQNQVGDLHRNPWPGLEQREGGKLWPGGHMWYHELCHRARLI